MHSSTDGASEGVITMKKLITIILLGILFIVIGILIFICYPINRMLAIGHYDNVRLENVSKDLVENNKWLEIHIFSKQVAEMRFSYNGLAKVRPKELIKRIEYTLPVKCKLSLAEPGYFRVVLKIYDKDDAKNVDYYRYREL